MALWSPLDDLMLGSGWPDSLKEAGTVKNVDNKKELFTYLSSMPLTGQLPNRKELNITEDDCEKHISEGTPTAQCNHREADICIFPPTSDALHQQHLNITIRQVFGSRQMRPRCLIIIQLIMAGRKTMVG